MKNSKIFIQIASYRDPQLVPTIKDCIANAKNPENLVFCIAWQHGPEENINEIKNLQNVKVIDIPYLNSKGACWARNQIQQRYDGEEYTFQLDSHHRFIKNWDSELIEMYEGLKLAGHNKPLLTGYIPSFDPENDPAGRVQTPWRMDFDRFIPEGAVFFLPASIDDHATRTSPVPARFYSAHFCFTSGDFCLEVPHDPEYYFHGEEISIAARAFTHGYDLFHPHKVIAWHEYTRKGRAKHWDDHSSANSNKTPDKKDWGERNHLSHRRNRILFSMDGEKHNTIAWGKYGFGNERSLRDYEKYSGLNFARRAVQQDTLDRKYPPNNAKFATEAEWEESFLAIFKHCIDLSTDKFPLNDYDFWCVAFERSDNTAIYREDANESECLRLVSEGRNPSGDKYIKLWRTFNASEKPHHWTVWPHSKSSGWGDRIVGSL
jgi:glycosyltransferase involved in cell wall biosynthesis